MMDLVGTGGGSYWPQKTARDVVAAYLNASFGFNYGLTTGQIAAMWYAAVEEYNSAGNPTDKLQALHKQLDGLNNNGDCLDDADGGVFKPHQPAASNCIGPAHRQQRRVTVESERSWLPILNQNQPMTAAARRPGVGVQ
jgi:hypothetical protein